METYKTFKSSNKENDVQQFIGQYGDLITLVVVNNIEYSVDTIGDLDEMKEDFFFEYSTNDDTKKAFNLIASFLSSKEDDKQITIKEEIKETKGNKIALMKLVASKFNKKITRKELLTEQPELHFELMRLGDIDYDLTWINIEIISNNK